MANYLHVAQILISIVLILVVLLQVKGAGGGFFGAPAATYRTRRGLEKTLFQFTIVLTALFLLISIISVRVVG